MFGFLLFQSFRLFRQKICWRRLCTWKHKRETKKETNDHHTHQQPTFSLMCVCFLISPVFRPTYSHPPIQPAFHPSILPSIHPSIHSSIYSDCFNLSMSLCLCLSLPLCLYLPLSVLLLVFIPIFAASPSLSFLFPLCNSLFQNLST